MGKLILCLILFILQLHSTKAVSAASTLTTINYPSLLVYPSEAQTTNADYVFQFSMELQLFQNKTIAAFDFSAVTSYVTLDSSKIDCINLTFSFMEDCTIKSNIISFYYVTNYTKQREKNGTDSFFLYYSSVGISLANIDTPDQAGTYGPIVMRLYNQSDTNTYYAEQDFYFTIDPGLLVDEGNSLLSEINTYISSTVETNYLLLYFQTSKIISQNAYFEIDIPDEITIGNAFDTTNQTELASNLTYIPCLAYQSLDDLECYQRLNISTTTTTITNSSGSFTSYEYVSSDVTQTILVKNSFNSSASFAAGIYSLKIYNISYDTPLDERTISTKPLIVRIYTEDGDMIEHSNIIDYQNYIIFEPESDYYDDFEDRATCDMDGCSTTTSTTEYNALYDFYYKTNGNFWRINENWISGDPCTNFWFGVLCNKQGNIIALHFFENNLNGILPDTFANLAHLKHLTISNDGREHENATSPNMNTIYLWNNGAINGLSNLEEINMQHLGMQGWLSSNIGTLVKLKYFNIAHNSMTGSLPDSGVWTNIPDLEMIELAKNSFSGSLPTDWVSLTKLEYVDVSYNEFTGSIPILTAAQDLKGIEFSGNLFTGDYPYDYFIQDSFYKLEYVNANFNPSIVVPERCIRYAFCFKRSLSFGIDGNDQSFVSSDVEYILQKIGTNFSFPTVDL